MNQTKTVLLLGILSVLLIAVGGAMSPGSLHLFVGLAVAMNIFSYYFSDKMVLMMHRAKEISQAEAPALHRIVEELAVKAGIPKPRVCLIPADYANAFATGRNPRNGVVAVTAGIMRILSERELKGVLAHEIAHIANRDILIATIASTMAAAISAIADVVRWGAIFGSRSDDDDGGSMAGSIALAVVAPFAALLLQLGVSRSREYIADATGAKLTNDPEALAMALQRLHSAADARPAVEASPATASLFIVNPFSGIGGMMNLFSTHPPVEERVRRLMALRGGVSFV